jgi:hypothetical protein
MKGKITIVLFSLVLVFGMLAASCDNGAYPDQLDNDKNTYYAYENVGDDLPVKKGDDGKITSPKLMKSADVYKALQRIKPNPADATGTTFVPEFKLDTVKMKAEWAGTAGDANEWKREAATKYAGMQILVTNPVLLPTP